MTSADVLRRAADLVEERARPLADEKWDSVENYPDSYVVRSTGRGYIATESGTGDIDKADADWMAMLGPQVSALLAAWLRAEARQWDRIAHLDDGATDHPALALALAILGEQT